MFRFVNKSYFIYHSHNHGAQEASQDECDINWDGVLQTLLTQFQGPWQHASYSYGEFCS